MTTYLTNPAALALLLLCSLKPESLQDDPDGANRAPSRKAWVNELTVIKEVDFRRYVASRYVKALIDPSVCVPLPHGRDKWDLMASDMIADPELTTWPAQGVKDVEQSQLWASWTPKQRSNFKNTFNTRFGWQFYFSTVQVVPPIPGIGILPYADSKSWLLVNLALSS